MAWTIALSDADISTLTTAYTMAAGSEGRMSASFTNRSTSVAATVQLWVVPSGETRGNEHLKEAGTTLGLAGTPQANLERFFVVPAGAVVFVQASTANVSCQVQGDLVNPTALESAGDGTASITYFTDWATDGSTSLRKSASGVVTLTVAVTNSGVGGGNLMTIPSGYRPPAAVNGMGYMNSTPQWPGYLSVSSLGVVSFNLFTAISGSPTSVPSSTRVKATLTYLT